MDFTQSLHLLDSPETVAIPPGGSAAFRFGVAGTAGALVRLRVSAAADADAGFRIVPERVRLEPDGSGEATVTVQVPKRSTQESFFFQLVAREDGAEKGKDVRSPSIEVRVEQTTRSGAPGAKAVGVVGLLVAGLAAALLFRGSPTQTYWPDGDGDGYGTPSGFIAVEMGASPPTGFVANADDCNDTASGTHPGAIEQCNGLDENCDGLVDEGVTRRFYPDEDGDGYGGLAGAVDGCTPVAGSLLTGGDCDDQDAAVRPGANESCNDKDDDCNGIVDDPFDGDGDGWRRDDESCPSAAPGALDCDDEDPGVHPRAVERCNGRDEDCDTAIDEDFDLDEDGYFDGTRGCAPVYPDLLDCNDAEASVNPGQRERCNGLDDDCDGVVDELFDADGDGFLRRGAACPENDEKPPDCDDSRAEAYPGASEVCNAADDDCDGEVDEEFDLDGDGYLIDTARCRASYPANRLDCDDARSDAYPTAPETCNARDDDCDGEIDEDFDRDSDGFYGRAGGCVGAYMGGLDCNDNESQVYPGASERCNRIDDDCDGRVDEGISEDADGDGHYTRTSCSAPHDDCDDGDSGVHPGAPEQCNAADDNCDGRIDERFDADGDGWFTAVEQCLEAHGERASDCDDTDPLVHPGQAELADGIDNDCSGGADLVVLTVSQTIGVCARREIGQPEVTWVAPEEGPLLLAPLGAQPGSAIASTNQATGRCATIRCERAGSVELEVGIGRLQDHTVTVQCLDPSVVP